MIHPTALVHEGALLGEGTVVWAGAHVMNGVKTGATNVLVENALCVHWSFMHQHKELGESGLLEEYRKLAENLGG